MVGFLQLVLLRRGFCGIQGGGFFSEFFCLNEISLFAVGSLPQSPKSSNIFSFSVSSYIEGFLFFFSSMHYGLSPA